MPSKKFNKNVNNKSDSEEFSESDLRSDSDDEVLSDSEDDINYYDELKVIKYNIDDYKECTEDIDVNKLHYIIQNKKDFVQFFNKAEHEFKGSKYSKKQDTFVLIEKYLKKSRNGKVKVLYKQKKGVGRYYAQRSLSLQCLKKEVRQCIALDYVDIDISNAGPSILKFVCEQNNIDCSILTKYCNNREKFWKDNNLTKEQGKDLFIKIIYGGGKSEIKKENKDYEKFVKEIQRIHDAIIFKHKKTFKKFEQDKKDKYKKSKKKEELQNIEGSFVSKILFDIENKILQEIYKFYESPKNAVLCFDGLMLKKSKDKDEKYYQSTLVNCEKQIYKNLHIKFKLAIKPFDDLLNKKIFDKLKDPLPEYNDIKLKYFSDFGKLVDKNIELEVIEEWLNNTVIFIDKGSKLLILIKNKKIDPDTKEKIVYWEQSSHDDIIKILEDIKCNVINPKYDYKLAHECKDDSKLFKSLPFEDRIKIKPFLYTSLSNGKKEGFYDVYKIHRKNLISDEESITNEYPSQRYEEVEFFPFLKRRIDYKTKGAYNLFTGYPLDKIRLIKTIDFTTSKWYIHMRDDLCNGNQAEFDNLLDWIAIKLQEPTVIIPSQVFYGIQGTGKGTFVEFMKRLLGCSNVVTIENIDAYLDKFNQDTSYKILKVLEEVEDKGKAYTNHNRLKADMVKKTERVELKYKNALTVNHFASYIFNTNNKNALKVEPNDRRFTFHCVGSNHADNIPYFDKIYEELNNEQYMKNAFEFFAEREYNKVNVRKAYQNYFKIQQKISDMPIGLKCIKYIIEEGIDKKFMHDDELVKGHYINNEYKTWCSKNGCNQYYNETTFREQLKLIGIEYKRFQRGSLKYFCYKINKSEVEKQFKIYLDAKDFVFGTECNVEDEGGDLSNHVPSKESEEDNDDIPEYNVNFDKGDEADDENIIDV